MHPFIAAWVLVFVGFLLLALGALLWNWDDNDLAVFVSGLLFIAGAICLFPMVIHLARGIYLLFSYLFTSALEI